MGCKIDEGSKEGLRELSPSVCPRLDARLWCCAWLGRVRSALVVVFCPRGLVQPEGKAH